MGSIPLYEQAQLDILRLIDERHAPGDLLPTQEELAKKIGASLITIKRALSELAREQVVESIRGRGTIVKGKSITDRRLGVSSWTDGVVGLGERPETGWTILRRETPSRRICNLLRLKSRQAVVSVERIRLVNGKPICLMRNILPADLTPGLEQTGLTHESLYQCLRERYGLILSRANETVQARQSTATERKHLGKDALVVLEIDRVTEDPSGRPIEWAQIIAHAKRYTYQIQLINPTQTDNKQP